MDEWRLESLGGSPHGEEAYCELSLCYGTALVSIKPALLREGVLEVEAEGSSLVLKGRRSFQRVALDGDFARLRRARQYTSRNPRSPQPPYPRGE